MKDSLSRSFTHFTETVNERLRTNELRIDQWMSQANARVKRCEEDMLSGVREMKDTITESEKMVKQRIDAIQLEIREATLN